MFTVSAVSLATATATSAPDREPAPAEFLTPDIGNPHLRDHLLQVVALLRAAETWKGFEKSFRRAFPPAGARQISMADVSAEWRAHEEALEGDT